MEPTRTLLKEIAMHSPNTTHQGTCPESRCNTDVQQFTLRGNRELISVYIGSSNWQATLQLQLKLERTHRQRRKQIDLKSKEINWLIGKKSHLSVENKLLIYKAVINTIWSYGIELWGCTGKSNIVIMYRSQSKILRAIANEPWYVTNHTVRTDFNIPYVSDVIHERINKHHNNLEAHANPLIEPLLQPITLGD